MFSPGKPPDRVIEHTIDLRLPRIDEWMGEPQGVAYLLMINFQWGYHHTRVRKSNTHSVAFGCHYEFWVTPLGLTDTLDIV